MTSSDIRFTTKGDLLYAFVLDWPKGGDSIIIKSLGSQAEKLAEIKTVSLLGCTEDLTWEQSDDALRITFPEAKVSDYAHALKIQFK